MATRKHVIAIAYKLENQKYDRIQGDFNCASEHPICFNP